MVIHDLNHEFAKATDDCALALRASDFSELPPDVKKEVRRIVSFRPEALLPDYFSELVCSQACEVWPESKMPLAVFIPIVTADHGFCDIQRTDINRCLEEWAAATHKRISFRLVSTADKADICFSQSGNLGESAFGNEGGVTYFLGNGKPNCQIYSASAANVVLAKPNAPCDRLSKDDIAHLHSVYLHEIGHALGIVGHSCQANDVMYFQQENSRFSHATVSHLSARDIATINRLYSDHCYSDADDTLKKEAAQGNPFAQCNLATAYAFGVPPAYDKAITLYRKSVEQGLPEAKSCLGILYAFGKGVPRDYEQAVDLFTEAASQGVPEAQALLAEMYQDGRGVQKDYKQAFDLYKKAANQGLPLAQTRLANMYYFGYGVPKDYKKALEWYQKAAVRDWPDAEIELGRMYIEGCGINQDLPEGMHWLQAGVKGLPADAAERQLQLGKFYQACGAFRESKFGQAGNLWNEWIQTATKAGSVAKVPGLADKIDYAACYASIAYRHEKRQEEADKVLALAHGIKGNLGWADDLVQYLRRQKTATEMLRLAGDSKDKRSELEFVLGADDLLNGKKPDALEHLSGSEKR